MNKTILLVEYDSAVIESITDLFGGDGFDFHHVEDGEAAKKVMEKKRFDLVITAAMLPKFHGFYLSQHIKETFPQTSVVIISGVFKGYEYRQQALTQYLADDYFEKPLDLIKLKSRSFELMGIKTDAADFDPSVTQIPKAKTNKIPTLKSLEQEQSKLTSDDIFGDILKKIEKSSSGVKIELDQPKTEAKTPPPPAQPPKPPITDRSDLLKDLVAVEKAPSVSPTVLLKKPINFDSILPPSENGGLEKPKKEYKKLEDDISKKFEETLSGLGLSSKPSAVKASAARSQQMNVPPVQIIPPKPQKTEMGEEVGGYEILGPIARGGMAEIYKAKKKGVKGFEKIIALKKILSGYGEDQKYIEMFVDEAKIAAQLTHPNIVQIYDLGRKDDYYFIAMEYVEGKDLRLLLRQLAENDAFLPLELSIYIIVKILEALYYAHTAKDNRGQTLDIVHRDVSPPNILIGYNGEIKLTDFGVSKASIKMHQTISGALKGKLLYMSPEQAKGDRNIDCRSDIFSAGVIFFEMLTNKKLFLDESEIQVLKKVQEGDITLPSTLRKDVDPELEEILLKSLKKDPKVRYQSAQEMAEALHGYLQKHYSQSPSPAHIAHYLMTQFAEEIRKNNIKVELKKEPYLITRRPSVVVEKPAESPKTVKVEIEKKTTIPPAPVPPPPQPPTTPAKDIPPPPPEASATQKIPVPPPVKETESKETIRSDEEFIAMEEHPIEIDLGGGRDDKPAKPLTEPVEKATDSEKAPPSEHKQEEPVPATSYHEELALLEKESGSRKKLLLIAAAAIVVVVGLFLILSPQKDSPAVSEKPEPAATQTATILPSSPEPSLMSDDQTAEDASEGENPEGGALLNETPADQQNVDPQTTESIPGKKDASETAPVETQPSQPPSQTPKTTVVPEKKPESNKTQDQKQTAKAELIKPKPMPPAAATEKKDNPQQTVKPGTTTVPPETAKNTEEEAEAQAVPVTPQEQPVQAEPKPVVPEPAKKVITEGMELAINELDVQPEKISTPAPEIPKKALKSIPANSTFLVRILINHKGLVEKIDMSKKTGIFDADMAIIGTLGKWTYKPGRKNNIAVKVWLTIPITLNQ